VIASRGQSPAGLGGGRSSGGLFITGFEGFSGTYFVGEPGGGTGDNTLVIGSGGENAYVSSGVGSEPGRDCFLVTHIEFAEGNGRATLYVNPTPGAAAPSGGVTCTGTDFLPDLASFRFVRQGETSASFDELRVGTTYAAVAPLVKDPNVPRSRGWIVRGVTEGGAAGGASDAHFLAKNTL
jgi:hypothetical protein